MHMKKIETSLQNCYLNKWYFLYYFPQEISYFVHHTLNMIYYNEKRKIVYAFKKIILNDYLLN